MEDRYSQLLHVLESAHGPLPGPDVAAQLHVSTRSIRKYVQDVNRKAGQEIVRATHHGYELAADAREVWRQATAKRRSSGGNPDERLYFIVRHLIQNSDTGTDVFELADLLSVSSSTIEADLGKARRLFREYHLELRRDHELLYLSGKERDQRRLVRQVLVKADMGTNTALIQHLSHDFGEYDMGALSQRIAALLADTELDIDEYALNDLVIHLTIAVDRVRQGHELGDRETPTRESEMEDDPTAVVIIEEVERVYGVTLPPREAVVLSMMLRARSKGRRRLVSASVVRPEVLQLVREAMRELSAVYLLEFYDEGALVDLAFHVQSMIERAHHGVGLNNPLGDSFKNMHPFIHELALFFAHQLEERTHITIGPGEVDFLSFHLGTQFQRQLDQGAPVTVAVVVPRYRATSMEVVAALSAALSDQAVITEVVSTMEYDWPGISADLIVSSVDLSGMVNTPVIPISPLLRREDIDRVTAAVRAEHDRAIKQEIRSTVLSMIEPALFHTVENVRSKEHALELMCHTMYREGVTPRTFYDDVVDRELRSSTAFGGLFAIPHAMTMDAHRSAISILVTEKDIPWGGSNVRLVVLFAVSPGSGRLIRDVLGGFIRVLAEPANVSRLIAAGTDHASLLAALSQMLA